MVKEKIPEYTRWAGFSEKEKKALIKWKMKRLMKKHPDWDKNILSQNAMIELQGSIFLDGFTDHIVFIRKGMAGWKALGVDPNKLFERGK